MADGLAFGLITTAAYTDDPVIRQALYDAGTVAYAYAVTVDGSLGRKESKASVDDVLTSFLTYPEVPND